MAAFNCGTEALMLGNLMMLASGLSVIAPSSASASFVFWSAGRRSAKAARIRPASDMSRSSTSIPAFFAKACTTGSSE
jgi:hypothetical protein